MAEENAGIDKSLPTVTPPNELATRVAVSNEQPPEPPLDPLIEELQNSITREATIKIISSGIRDEAGKQRITEALAKDHWDGFVNLHPEVAAKYPEHPEIKEALIRKAQRELEKAKTTAVPSNQTNVQPQKSNPLTPPKPPSLLQRFTKFAAGISSIGIR